MGVKGSSRTKDALPPKKLYYWVCIGCIFFFIMASLIFSLTCSQIPNYERCFSLFRILSVFLESTSRFFLTAPDGWKNTIRHNLCFSNSFKKTPQQVSGDGKRKSCLWHLTLDGRQRLRDEINMLTGDSFRMLRRSMNYPGQNLKTEWVVRSTVKWILSWFHSQLCPCYRYDSSAVKAVIQLWPLCHHQAGQLEMLWFRFFFMLVHC